MGNVLNVPLRAGSGSREFRAAYEREVLPALQSFAPDFIFISAGFDAHRDDPLAELELVESDFSWVTQRHLRNCADVLWCARCLGAGRRV